MSAVALLIRPESHQTRNLTGGRPQPNGAVLGVLPLSLGATSGSSLLRSEYQRVKVSPQRAVPQIAEPRLRLGQHPSTPGEPAASTAIHLIPALGRISPRKCRRQL